MALTQISTAGVKDDAVTSGKIPANAVGSSEIADTAVTLAKLEHGTSSNDGKFLRANNGADPTFETVTGTTINNNADNRVITGSGTANTLEGESGLTFDGTTLTVAGASNATQAIFSGTGGSGARGLEIKTESGGAADEVVIIKTRASGTTGAIKFQTNGANSLELAGNGGDVTVKQGNLKFGIGGKGIDFSSTGDASGMAGELLDDYEEGTWSPVIKYNGGRLTPHADNIGVYTKIGKNVTVTGTIRWSGIADSSDTSWFVRVTNLPYTPKQYNSSSPGGAYRTGQVMGATNGSAITPSNSNYTNLVIFLDAGASYFYIVQHNVASGGYDHTPTVHGSGTIYGFQLTYQTT